MNKLTVTILFLLVAFKTSSQPVITGRITDNKKKNIAGISVGIVNNLSSTSIFQSSLIPDDGILFPVLRQALNVSGYFMTTPQKVNQDNEEL